MAAPSMDFLRRRIQNSPEAMEALSQEVSNRVLSNVNAGEPKAAMKMLNGQRRSIIGAVGKEQYDAMRNVVEPDVV